MREWKLQSYHHDWSNACKYYTDDRWIRVTGNAQAPQHMRINVPTGQVNPQTGEPILENQIAEMDVDIILDEGPDTVTMREELIEQLSQRPDIPSEILIELSNLPDKDLILQKLQEHKSPPPEIMELQKRMGQLEELKAAAELDKIVADTDKVHADAAIAGLGAGVPPQMLPQLGQLFPFLHREPTFLDQAQQLAGGMPQNALAGPPDGMAPPGGGMPPPNALGGPGGAGGAMPPGAEAPQEDFLAESSTPWIPGEEPQLNQAGGLPLPPGGV
jgi:hypothetical protein